MMVVRLLLAALWIAVGVAMLVSPGFGRYGAVGGWFAIVMGLYNVMRWYAARSTPAPPRRRVHREPEPYTGPNPDFDFDLRRPEMD